VIFTNSSQRRKAKEKKKRGGNQKRSFYVGPGILHPKKKKGPEERTGFKKEKNEGEQVWEKGQPQEWEERPFSPEENDLPRKKSRNFSGKGGEKKVKGKDVPEKKTSVS